MRKGAANMLTFTKAMSDEEMKTAAEYFASLPVKRWTRVVEAETVPKSYFLGTRRMPLPEGGTEPIGMRVIEIPEDAERVELRDPKSGFVAYAPPGSLAKGLNLVATGGNGKTIACTICHGPTLKGVGEVPGIAGQSPDQSCRLPGLFRGHAGRGLIQKDDFRRQAQHHADVQPLPFAVRELLAQEMTFFGKPDQRQDRLDDRIGSGWVSMRRETRQPKIVAHA